MIERKHIMPERIRIPRKHILPEDLARIHREIKYTDDNLSGLLTARQVVAMLDITNRTLQNWRNQKFKTRRKLKSVRLGNKWSKRYMLAEKEVSAWLNDYRNKDSNDLYTRWLKALRDERMH
jgi:Helix-turn-helix domain